MSSISSRKRKERGAIILFFKTTCAHTLGESVSQAIPIFNIWQARNQNNLLVCFERDDSLFSHGKESLCENSQEVNRIF